MRQAKFLVPLGALALALGCADPRITEYEPHTGIITGTVLYQHPTTAGPCGSDLAGNVVITLFRADALPPPQGTNGPVNFIVVPEAEIFNAEPDNGLYSAPFTIPNVPAGRYQIRAFVDADDDFRPTIDLLAQTTGGDVGGGHVDTATGDFLEVEVADDAVTAQVTVSIGRIIPTERPAFAHAGATEYSVPFTTPQPMVISARPQVRENLKMDPACNYFLVQYADVDGDGVVDDTNGDHLPDLFPQVLLRLERTETQTRNIVIPGIIDPLPYQDALAVYPAVPTTTVAVLLPPVAVEIGADGSRTILPAIPAGRYETIVIQSTGQTWQVPNNIDLVDPMGGPDATQAVYVEMKEGPALPPGGVTGSVTVDTEKTGDVYVVAFSAAAPPPPSGTGSPVALATVPAATFTGTGAGRTAPFRLAGLPDGSYILVGLMDVDGDFSPVVSALSQASAGDYSGVLATPVSVQGGLTEGVSLTIGTEIPFDRPAFTIDAGLSVARSAFPATITLTAHAYSALGITEQSAQVPVRLSAGDQEDDNFQDMLPRVLLSRMVDEVDPRGAANDPRGIIIPGLVEPLPFYGPLVAGVPAIPTGVYAVVLPPVAVELSTGAQLAPPPAGRYRINVLSATGQTWSVPNDLDVAFNRVGGPLEDASQARYLTVEDTPLPRGGVSGQVQLTFAPPEGDFSVVVFAFTAGAPPPPLGRGSPVASAVLRKPAFAGGTTAAFTLAPLATGAYTVRAFLDANDDFTPWYGALNQPDATDVGGGYVDERGVLQTVTVDAEAGVTPDVPVTVLEAARYPFDRPAFAAVGPVPVLNPSAGPVTATFAALQEITDVATIQAVFPVQWVDLNADGQAEDINGDGNPDVFPIVVAELLREDDESNLTVDPRGIRVPGIVSPLQFAPLGFPATDPTATATIALATSMQVVFPPLASSDEVPGTPIVPPKGRYRITFVNRFGQTWTVPNALQRATGTPFVASQGVYLTVSE
ncbi:MAG: hypothetical protein KC933_24530 [Myxococcales bacterium]|nr:hypothetical protein [Myxococcales bacterium]